MRTYGRVKQDNFGLIFGGPGVIGGPGVMGGGVAGTKWVEVDTDAKGFNDYVYITTLVQCLKLSIGESPFWGDWGIPAKRSVVQQVFPDYYVALMQQRFSQFFASLTISKRNSPTPTYDIAIVTHQGATLQFAIEGIPV